MAEQNEQLIRVYEAGIKLTTEEEQIYLQAADEVTGDVPVGYKKCGGCGRILKFYKFNRNSNSKMNCTGNCKECQKGAAKKSYDKNRGKRNYKAYYAENKEAKREQGRAYYENHKDDVLARQKEYRKTSKGKKVMNRAHNKRKKTMAQNAGIPYTREMVIERDKMGGEFPICVLCGEPITKMNALHMEHLIPVVLGGKDCFTNVGCAHDLCNLRKSKDARELTAAQVEDVIDRAEKYIDAHPDQFPGFSETDDSPIEE